MFSAAEIKVPQNNLKSFNKRIDSLKKKAQKLGGQVICDLLYTKDEERFVFINYRDDHDSLKKEFKEVKAFRVHIFALTILDLEIPGWTIVANKKKLDNVVFYFGEEKYNHVKDICCEHCHQNRARKESSIIKDSDGNYKEVGTSCINDYTGSIDAERIARFYANLYEELTSISESYELGFAYQSGEPRITKNSF